jgi:hypothetical protein
MLHTAQVLPDEKESSWVLEFLERILSGLDRGRAWLLRHSLQIRILRMVYKNCSLRLGTSFLLMSSIYLMFALKRPDILLVWGPLLFGYLHLVASYRFMRGKLMHPHSWTGWLNEFQILAIITVAAMLIHAFAKERKLMPEMPYGAWEIIVAAVAFSFVGILLRSVSLKSLLLCGLITFALLRASWLDPLKFVGVGLFIHNWIAFVHWIKCAKSQHVRGVAIVSSLIFGLLHYGIFTGRLDAWMTVVDSNGLSAANIQATAWALAPWSKDPVVWHRAVVAYTFGLSMHYFVWLKAIPESLSSTRCPNSFCASFRKLVDEIGERSTIVILLWALIGIIVWCFDFRLGATIYFAFATLHGWLEIVYLLGRPKSLL